MTVRLAVSLMMLVIPIPDRLAAQTGQVTSTSVVQHAPDEEDIEIYSSVLRFFRPFGRQMRWLDSRLARTDGGSSQALPSELVDSLVRRAGRHFERLTSGLDEDDRSGGVVRLSRIDRVTTDSVRVGARYQHHSPYYTQAETDLSFLVVKRKGKWVLVKP